MNFSKNAKLKLVHDKVMANERLDEKDGIFILESGDLLELGWLADKVRREKVGDYVSFVNNYHICFTNICKNSCYHCKFRKEESDKDAFLLSHADIIDKAYEAKKLKVPEVLLMGSVHPSLKFDFYLESVRVIKKVIPDVKILAYSAVEVNHFAKMEGKDPLVILQMLKEAGLTAFTGGGVDFLDDAYIERLSGDSKKLCAKDWIYIHTQAHKLSIATNACMIYGVSETYQEVVENLRKIRDIQDETGGFTHFFPYGFGDDGNKMTDGLYDLKMLILARLYLDNFDHIRVYWGYVGKRLAQISLSFGVDDLNGVRQKGRIIHTTGNIKPSFSSENEMVKIISRADKVPVERDILFNKVREFSS